MHLYICRAYFDICRRHPARFPNTLNKSPKLFYFVFSCFCKDRKAVKALADRGNSYAYDRESRPVSYPAFNRWDAGAIGGIDLTLGHFIIGYDVCVGLTSVSDAGFMGNPVGNAATAVLLGAHPKNIMADLSVGYRF